MHPDALRNPGSGLTRRVRPLVYSLVAIVACIVFLTWIALQAQVALASFLNADTAWLNAQSRATISLLKYVDSGDAADYAHFQREFATLEAFRRARDQVLSGHFDYASVAAILSQGNATVVTPRNAIFMFAHFSRAPYLRHAVALWKSTDAPVAKLQTIAQAMHRAYATGTVSAADRDHQRARIDAIDDVVTRTNPRFSASVTQGAVVAGRAMFGLILGLAVVAILLWLSIAHRVLVRIHGDSERYRLLFDNASDAIVISDGDSGRILDGNRTARAWTRQDALVLTDLTYPQWFTQCRLHEATPGSAGARGSAVDLRPVEVQHTALILDKRRLRQSIIRDISERVANERRLARLALHDPLTGLINRTEFERHCNRAIVRATRDCQRVAVMFIDLDGFKEVNDHHGHAAGDKLLKLAAGRMARPLRDGDVVGRIGGDEFAILLAGLAQREDAANVADRLLAALSAPFLVGGRALTVSASIGIASFPDDGDTALTVIASADDAMYAAKRSGPGARQFAQSSTSAPSPGGSPLDAELRLP